MHQVSLIIRGLIFIIEKDVLCTHSDYFRAMFSGNYVEDNQQHITIDVLDPNIMDFIIEYMQNGRIENLQKFSLPVMGSISMAANYLQITELMKSLEHILDSQLMENNWLEIMTIAKKSSYSKLEHLSLAFGLYSFKSMQPEHISSLQTLTWYLSHPYLDATSEYNVFNFGFQWLKQNEAVDNDILCILSCLDVTRLNSQDVTKIKDLIHNFENSYVKKVVDCLYKFLTTSNEITEHELDKRKTELCEKYTERVWREIYNVVKNSKPRKLEYTPIIRLWIPRYPNEGQGLPHYLHTYDEKDGLKQWLEVAEPDLWGWKVVPWGLTKFVVVLGEYGLGTGNFMRDVRVYDTLRKEWTRHGVELPHRRHGGVIVIGDLLYIVGGTSNSGPTDSAGIYDLKQKTYRDIAKFPASYSPRLFLHQNELYAGGHSIVYRYENSGVTDCWVPVVETELPMSSFTSYKNFIYGTQGYKKALYRLRLDVDNKFELCKKFLYSPAGICNIGEKLILFTAKTGSQSNTLFTEELEAESSTENVKALITKTCKLPHRNNDPVNSCVLVLSLPPLHLERDIPDCAELQHGNNKNESLAYLNTGCI